MDSLVRIATKSFLSEANRWCWLHHWHIRHRLHVVSHLLKLGFELFDAISVNFVCTLKRLNIFSAGSDIVFLTADRTLVLA